MNENQEKPQKEELPYYLQPSTPDGCSRHWPNFEQRCYACNGLPHEEGKILPRI